MRTAIVPLALLTAVAPLTVASPALANSAEQAGPLFAEVSAVSPGNVRTDMKARFEVSATYTGPCAGCVVQVGLGKRVTRVGSLGPDGAFGQVVSLVTPDEPGYYDTKVRVVRPDGSVATVETGKVTVHGIVAWHLRARAADRSVDEGDSVVLRGRLSAEDVDGSEEDVDFRGRVRLQYRKGDRWITLKSVDARRESVVVVRAKAVRSGDHRLLAVSEDTASNTVHVNVVD